MAYVIIIWLRCPVPVDQTDRRRELTEVEYSKDRDDHKLTRLS